MSNIQYAVLIGMMTFLGCCNMFVMGSWGRAIVAAIRERDAADR